MDAVTKETDLASTQTDWKRLRFMTDDYIARAVADDPDAAPIPIADELRQYKPTPPRNRRRHSRVTLWERQCCTEDDGGDDARGTGGA